MDRSVPPKLLEELSKAADIVRGHDFIHIFSHYDADGLSSAAILAKTLLREKKEFRVTLFTTLDDETFREIAASNADCFILSDIGASYVKELDGLKPDIIVLDHHTPEGTAERICCINPHLHDIDGMKYGCGATMSCLFGITMDENNWDLVQIAFAGMSGDRQIIDGLNGYLLDGAVKRNLIEIVDGSVIPFGSLTDNLFLAVDPYVRGVSGNAEGVAGLLTDAGIPRDAKSQNLSETERRKLSSLIVLDLIEQGVSAETVEQVADRKYSLNGRNMDSAELASLLDGCGRNGLTGLGVAVACGDEDSLAEAEKIRKEYRRSIVLGAKELDDRGLTQESDIQWFDSSESGYTGVLCGVAMSYFADPSKPTFGINTSEELGKVSGRATDKLLSRGVDLSEALKKACAAVGGSGGGHRIASGGSFPSDHKEEFIKILNETIGEQFSAK